MHPSSFLRALGLLAALCVPMANAVAGEWPRFHAHDVSGDTRQCRIQDINASGQILGHAVFRDRSQGAFVTQAHGAPLMRIGGNPRDQVTAHGLNDAGTVVGAITPEVGESRNFVWDAALGLRTLTLPGGTDYSVFHDINNHGEIVGRQVLDDGYYTTRGVRIRADGSGYALLGTLGGDVSEAFLISDNGAVSGRSNVNEGDYELAFVQPAGSTQLLRVGATASERKPWLDFSVQDMGARGQLMGTVRDGRNARTQTYLATPEGELRRTVRWSLPAGSTSTEVQMLDQGQGELLSGYRQHQRRDQAVIDAAVLGNTQGELVDLIDLVVNPSAGMVLSWGIFNSQGQMAVQGRDAAGQSRCYILCREAGCGAAY